ncbi:MAG: hypothetical protein FWD28_07260 [Treponema sp.]|nr:hypothetical protein [Treponema sp.]
MKKYILIIVIFLSCSIIYATEANIRITGHHQRNIISSGKTTVFIFVENNGNNVLYNLELSALNDDNMEITFESNIINKIEPKESIIINVDINNKNKYIFDKDTFITYKISNNVYSNEFRHKYTIKPVENFWFFTILSIALLLTILFVLLFVKLDKGEKDVG